MAKTLGPYYPIIYVRGYAMTPGEIAETVSTPYMGFNLGSTKIRQIWDQSVQRHIFESALIRLMKEYGYSDNYLDGAEKTGELPARSIVIYRYYDPADKDFGNGQVLSIPEAATGLRDLIHRVRDQVCGDDDVLREPFKVNLVAHSMGGLVCRCFLQNDDISTPADRALVNKVFTYATPHNGIDMAGLNVPSILGLWDLNNFNRKHMATYLGLSEDSERVDSLDNKFEADRFFCFVGTNHRDYDVALGLSRRLAGEMSDGLVKIVNATVSGAPRAFAYRSHSGPYGVVNSEEGYQNLVRFLFGDVRVDGILEVDNLPLPPSIKKAYDDGKEIRASYYFEATVATRGSMGVKLTERRKDTYSAVIRGFDELMRSERLNMTQARSPVLFSVFLDSQRITVGRTLVFSLDLAVSTTGYYIGKVPLLRRHVDGEYLFRNTITFKLTHNRGDWSARYTLTDDHWSENPGAKVTREGDNTFVMELSSPKGFKGRLRFNVTNAVQLEELASTGAG